MTSIFQTLQSNIKFDGLLMNVYMKDEMKGYMLLSFHFHIWTSCRVTSALNDLASLDQYNIYFLVLQTNT